MNIGWRLKLSCAQIFNIPGFKIDTIQRVKRKSLMKQTYIDAGVAVAQGRVAQTLTEARRFVKEVGYPLVAKPDIGVGAAKTYKIQNYAELTQFFQLKPPVDYILEEFIQGTILTFDWFSRSRRNACFQFIHAIQSWYYGDGK